MPKLGPDYDDPRAVKGGAATGATAVAARGTEEKALTGFESLRGGSISDENPDHEDVGDVTGEGLVFADCDRIPDFERVEEISGEDMRRLWFFTGRYSSLGSDGTPCLFKMARSIQNSLFAVARRDPEQYVKFIDRLVDIHGIVKARTEKPYKLIMDTRPRAALPKAVLDHPPFSEYPRWKANLRAAKKGNFVIVEPIPIVAKDEPIAQRPELQSQLDAAMEELDRKIVDMTLSSRGMDNTPLIKKGVSLLTRTTLGKIRKATGVVVNPPFEGQPLIKQTEFIYYHSVYSVVLDRTGEPTTLPNASGKGLLNYPILVPDPGSVMERNLHSHGVYVSVKHYGDSDFMLGEDGSIKKMLWGGIGGLVENLGGGVRPFHEFHERLQQHILSLGYAYVGAVVSPSAFSSPDISVDLLEEKFPILVEATLPYTAREAGKLAKHDLENWESLVKSIGIEIIKQVILAEVKRRVRNYLIRKIGTKVIPLINMASALYDAFTGEEERIRVRNMIGCILLHAKGSGPDDLHIAAKILGKILAELFREEIIQAIVKKAAEKGQKAVQRHSKDDTPRMDEETAGEKTPYEVEESDDNDLSRTLDSKKPAPASVDSDASAPNSSADGTGGKATGSGNRSFDPGALAREIEQGRELANRLKAAQQPGDAPTPMPKAKGNPEEENAPPPQPRKKAEEEDQDDNDRTPVGDKSPPKKKTAKEDENEGEEEPPQAKSPKNKGPKEAEPDQGDQKEKANQKGKGDPGTRNNGKANRGVLPKPKAKKPKPPRKRDPQKLKSMLDWYLKVRARWKNGFNIIMKAIKNRHKLRSALKIVSSKYFAHHLVPVIVLRHNEVAQAAVVGGYDFNGKVNGRKLNKPEHEGGHNEYNEIIASEMDEWAKNNPGYTPKQARDFVEGRVSAWGDMYVQSLEMREPQAGPGHPDIEPEPDDE